MALTTRFDISAGQTIVALSPDDEIAFGTIMLGSTYGHIKSASVKRAADLELIEKSGGSVRAALLLNPRFELTLEVLLTFDKEGAALTLGDEIAFPVSGINGNVLDWELKWEEKGHRLYSLSATSWDSMIDPKVYEYDGAPWALLFDPAA